MDGVGFIVTQIHKSIESKGGEEDNVTFHGWMATQKRVEHSRGKCPFMDEVVISLSTVRSPFFRPYLGYFNCCTQISNRLLLLFATSKFLILRCLQLNWALLCVAINKKDIELLGTYLAKSTRLIPISSFKEQIDGGASPTIDNLVHVISLQKVHKMA